MRILVISDSHGNWQQAIRAWEQAAQPETIIHLGDGCRDTDHLSLISGREVIRVAGNCDIGLVEARELLIEVGNKMLLLTHGDIYGVKSGLSRLEQRGKEVGADIVLFGHTHHATIVTLSGMLIINPGTLMPSGSHATFAVLELTDSGVSARLYDVF
jgi:putative phosphoesterase